MTTLPEETPSERRGRPPLKWKRVGGFLVSERCGACAKPSNGACFLARGHAQTPQSNWRWSFLARRVLNPPVKLAMVFPVLGHAQTPQSWRWCFLSSDTRKPPSRKLAMEYPRRSLIDVRKPFSYLRCWSCVSASWSEHLPHSRLSDRARLP